MARDTLIDIQHLSKRYPGSPTPALDDLSLQVAAGEVYAFLGANGAGKSTTIRTVMGFIQPSSGTATICGLDSVKDSTAAKRHVGYLAGEVALYPKMTGGQFLEYMAELQPLTRPAYLSELTKRFRVELHKPLGTLSKGNRQKIGLLQAVMHQPTVLILDEPTSGLDPLMQEEFFKLILEAKQRGAAVFVSSHNFAEVERMSDRIGFIRQGRLAAERSLDELAAQAAHTFVLTFQDKAPVKALGKLPGAKLTAHDDHHVTISVEGELTALFSLLARHHVTRLHQQEVNLEEEFLHFYQQEDTPA